MARSAQAFGEVTAWAMERLSLGDTYGSDFELQQVQRSDRSQIGIQYDDANRAKQIALASAKISMGYDVNGTLTLRGTTSNFYRRSSVSIRRNKISH